MNDDFNKNLEGLDNEQKTEKNGGSGFEIPEILMSTAEVISEDEKNKKVEHELEKIRKQRVAHFSLSLENDDVKADEIENVSSVKADVIPEVPQPQEDLREIQESEEENDDEEKEEIYSDSRQFAPRPAVSEISALRNSSDNNDSTGKLVRFSRERMPDYNDWEESGKVSNKWRSSGKKVHKKGGCLKGFVITTAILVCSVITSAYLISCVNDLLGFMKTDTPVTVTVPANANNDTIADILKSNGLIDQEMFFKIFTNFKYRNEKKYPGFIAGQYELNGKMGYEGMVNLMKYPVLESQTVQLTFPEGYSLIDIAKKLEENNVCTVEAFIKAINEEEYKTKLVKAIPEDERFYRLEGYLFPDTYEFYINENPKSVVTRFVDNAQNRIRKDLYDRAKKMDMTMDEVIILASIIQKEASDPNEMGKVSSVFHNRLKKSRTFPNLQSDPTINYVENCIKPYLKDASQGDKYAELYSTYKCIGLPVAPICSPGIAAIRAALYPEQTRYYFFVTDDENTYYYASTDAQHEANKKKAERVNEKLKAQAEANAAA